MSDPHPVSETKETSRIEAFSDGVFAIAITLLILTIPVPRITDGDLIGFVGLQWPFFCAYAISFLTILVMWANHHGVFNLIVRTDRPFLIINGVLLLFITFVNYPTAIIAASVVTQATGDQRLHQQQFAGIFYTVTLIIISVIFNLLWRYAAHNSRLLDAHADPQTVKQVHEQYRYGPLAYFLPLAASFFNIFVALSICLVLGIYFGLTAQIDSPHPAHSHRAK